MEYLSISSLTGLFELFLKKSVFCHYVELTTADSMCRQAEKQGQTWVWLSRSLQQSSHTIPHVCAQYTQAHKHTHTLTKDFYSYLPTRFNYISNPSGRVNSPAWGCSFSYFQEHPDLWREHL